MFIVLILLFASRPEKGLIQNTLIVGDEQFELIYDYQKGEEITNYLKLSARLSAQQETFDIGVFKSNFEKYLQNCNSLYGTELDIQFFDIQTDFSTQVIVKAKEPLIFDKDKYYYSVYPSFRILL